MKLMFIDMSHHQKTAKLSKACLELKFMKRSKIRVEAEKEAEETSTMFSSQISQKMKSGQDKYIIEESYVPIEDLRFGRMSFKGMNPEIEKLMKKSEMKNPKRSQMDADISDEKMACLALSMAKKFKKNKKNSKYKFVKPDDSD